MFSRISLTVRLGVSLVTIDFIGVFFIKQDFLGKQRASNYFEALCTMGVLFVKECVINDQAEYDYTDSDHEIHVICHSEKSPY